MPTGTLPWDSLGFAGDAGGQWETEVADAGAGTGLSFDMVVDSSLQPHIVYRHEEALKYTTYDGTDWSREDIAVFGVFGMAVSLAVDADDTLHLAFYDGDSNTLKYAKREGETWSTPTIVDDSGAVGDYASIAVNDAGDVFISYQDVGNTSLKFASNEGGGWEYFNIDAESGTGYFTSIAVAPSGLIGIAYAECSGSDTCRPKMAVRDGGGWEVEAIGADIYDARHFSALAGDGALGTAYYAEIEAGYGELRFTTGDLGAWDEEVVTSDVGWDTAVAATASDVVAISYLDPARGRLKVATPAGDTWSVAIVDAQGGAGHRSDIAVDAGGALHMCYHREPSEALYYATNAGGGWTTELVASVGRDCAIALGPEGGVHILSVDESAASLNLADNADGAWQNNSVAVASTFGGDTDLLADEEGNLYLSFYYGEVTYDIIYADNTTGTFNFETIDQTTGWGSKTSLGLDSAGNIHLVYVAGNNFDPGVLKYARRSVGGQWSLEDIDTDAGLWATLVVDDFNNAHVAYYGWTDGDLNYATNADDEWQITAIDVAGDVGDFASMAYSDEHNSIHIAYYASSALYFVRFPVGFDWD